MDHPDRLAARRHAVLVAGGIAIMTLSWILLTPPGGGPDEQAHLVRSAGLLRGDLSGERVIGTSASKRYFDVPAWMAELDAGCWAQDPNAPASCQPPPTRSGTASVASTAHDYPVWGHLAPGIGSFVDGARRSLLVSRALSAAVPLMLVGAAMALARRHSASLAAGVAIAVTPMAWSTFAQVNPSSLVIAGGVATFVGGLLLDRDVTHRWLFVAGVAAAALPRRDGALWVATATATVAIVNDWSLVSMWRWLTRWQQGALIATGLMVTLWAVTAPGSLPKFALAAPLLTGGPLAARWLLRDPRLPRPAAVAGIVVAVIVAALAALSVRSTPFDSMVARIVVTRTGERLRQAIGVLSWLDTPVPTSALFLFLVAVGVLAGAALGADSLRPALAAGSVVLAAIALSWVIELAQGTTTGTYWQGRYYLPLLVGAPILLGFAVPDRSGRHPLVALTVSIVVWNVAVYAAARRWGVGIFGTIDPRQFDTYGVPTTPLVLLVAHALGSVTVWVALRPSSTAHERLDTSLRERS
jgi:hypothetical protein